MGETQDATQYKVTVQEAARRLGVKEDAIRKRIQRRSIRHQKAPDGRVWVWVSVADEEFRDAGPTTQDAAQDEYRDTAQDDRIEDLREQVAYLRRQLDEEREARRRADTILVQLSAANAEQARTIREIEAPATEEFTEAADTVKEPERAKPRSGAAGPQTGTQPPQGGGLRGLRQRLLGW